MYEGSDLFKNVCTAFIQWRIANSSGRELIILEIALVEKALEVCM